MTRNKGKLNKKPKLEVKFDDTARREFLSGFHKRKLQKKAFYKSKLEKRLALEKQRIKAEAKKSVGRVSSSHSILPEVEKIIGFTQGDLEDELKTKSESFVLGSKTVTISSLDDIHTKLPPLEDSEEDSEDDEVEEDSAPLPLNKNVKSMLKRTTNQLLQQSKAYKASQRFKQRSKKSRAKNRLARAGTTSKTATPEQASGKEKISAAKRGKQKQKGAKQLHPMSKKGKRARLDPRNTKATAKRK